MRPNPYSISWLHGSILALIRNSHFGVLEVPATLKLWGRTDSREPFYVLKEVHSND